MLLGRRKDREQDSFSTAQLFRGQLAFVKVSKDYPYAVLRGCGSWLRDRAVNGSGQSVELEEDKGSPEWEVR